MSRVHDVGGQQGFGPVDPDPGDHEPFHADWEARVFALNTALLRRGVFNLDEMRDAIERIPPQRYLAASYYERWLIAIETMLQEKGVLSSGTADTETGPGPGPETRPDTGPGRGPVLDERHD